MAVIQPPGLAVARLTELRPARSHRYHDGKPMEGFCLITSDSGFSRVTLHVENGQTLTDRSGSGGFYYEGWLVGPAGVVSLGAFNLGPDGRGSATRVVAASQVQPGRAEQVRVTVEPFGGSRAGAIAVLEGKLIWLDAPSPALQPGAAAPFTPFGPPASQLPGQPAGSFAGPADGPAGGAGSTGSVSPFTGDFAGSAAAPSAGFTAPDPANQAATGVAVLPSQDAPGASAAGGSPAAPAGQPEGGAAPGQAPPADRAAGGGAPAAQTEAEPPAAESSEPSTGGPGQEADAQAPAAGAAAPQPVPRHVNPLSVQVQLVQRHPMTPRATGTATLNLRRGHLTLALRGLPSPTALGRDQKSGRPFNAYRVWLINQKTHMRTPVGYCERVWGENFRFEADGLPLNRSDTILITAEDRSVATSTGHPAPQVLIGSYDPRI